MKFVTFGLPDSGVWRFPNESTPIAPSPFSSEWLSTFYRVSLHSFVPMTIALVYFTLVHAINPIVQKRQIRQYQSEHPDEKKRVFTDAELKRLKPAPYAIARTAAFKVFVLLHNVFLAGYLIWTFVGMTSSMASTMRLFKWEILPRFGGSTSSTLEVFFQTVCDEKQGIFSRLLEGQHNNLEVFGYWFYISKFYEVLDTVIILLKGRPSSLLQSYHHSGAMMCMWAGVRYQSPPIWIFVVFNSFIHLLMYVYFLLSCMKIRVPQIFKRALTSLQITQFVVGGSVAIVHAFVRFIDTSLDPLDVRACINSRGQALSVLLNVAYLAPLTALFGAFYVESYLKKKK